MLKESFSTGFFNEQRIGRVSLFLALGGVVFWSWLLTLKYSLYGYYDIDLSLYAHTLWNLSHGSSYSSLYGTTFLADHLFYVAFLLAPLYKFFSHPLFLVNLKIFSFFAGSLILYRIAAQKTTPAAGFVFQIAYIFFPANIYMLLFEFNFESLAIAFIFALFYYFHEGKKLAFVLIMLFLCTIKENIPLLIFMFGCYGLIVKKKERLFWGLLPMLIGAGSFLLSIFVVTPAVRSGLANGGGHIYFTHYASLGGSPSVAVAGLLRDPFWVVNALFSIEDLRYYSSLLGAHLPFALGSPFIVGISLPLVLQCALSSAWQLHTIFFHYSATVAPFIFLATVSTFGWIREKGNRAVYRACCLIFILLSGLQFQHYSGDMANRIALWPDRLDAFREQIVKQVPPQASVVATFEILNHLLDRKQAYTLFHVWRGTNIFTGESPYRSADVAEYAAVDLKDPWIMADFSSNPQGTAENLKHYFLNASWEYLDSRDDIVLLRKPTSSSQFSLLRRADRPFVEDMQVLGAEVGDSLRLEGVLIVQPSTDATALPITYYWRNLENSPSCWTVMMLVEKDGQVVYSKNRLVGYSFYPTFLWAGGEYVRDHYVYALPSLPSGRYIVRLRFANVDWNSGSLRFIAGDGIVAGDFVIPHQSLNKE